MNPFADPLYATLLVLVVTNTRVLLAADSRKNTLHPDGTREEGTMDKIFRTGDCYYAVSGFSSTSDGSFSLQGVIHKTLLLYADFRTAIKQMAPAIATELKAYLGSLQKSSPRLFAQLLRDSFSGGEIVLVKRIGSMPTAVLLTYKIAAGRSVKVEVDTWSINSSTIAEQDDCFWRAIGHTAFLDRGMPSLKEVAQHPAATAKRIIEQGAKAHPHFVGGCINLLELTKEWERWIEKSPTTPARL